MSDTDLELIARYARHHVEDAFAEIVDDKCDTHFRIGPNGAGYRLATGPTGASSRQFGYTVSFDDDELRNGELDADDEY